MKYVRIIMLLLVTFSLVFLIKNIPKKIKISNIDCISQYGVCSQQIRNEIESIKLTNLVKTKSEVSALFDNHLLVSKFSYQYIFPDKLRVYVVETKGIYAIKPANGNRLYLVNNGGTIISIVDSTNLPILEIGEQQLDIGLKLEDRVRFAGKILYNVYYSYQVTQATLKEDGLYVNLNGIDVIFPLEGDEKILVGSLNAVLNRLRSDYEKSKIDNNAAAGCVCYIQNQCKSACLLDLRFKNPVIR